jgi:predicted nucleic-acid-binding protein
MLAIDTNLLVRYLALDDPAQSARARKVIDNNEVFVPTTVLLEAEWVLRSAYGHPRHALAEALAGFCGLPQVTLQDPPAVKKALGWMRSGLDFADGLHLAACGHCDAFISFDQSFARAASALGAIKVRVP